MSDVVIVRGGHVVGAAEPERADVVAADGRVVEIGPDLEAPSGAVEIDAGGCLVAPGLVDLSADLGGPGDLERETPTTGSAAAALGGFTSVLVCSTPASPIDSAAALAARRALDPGLVHLHYAAAMTVGHEGATLSPMAELVGVGASWFTEVVESCVDTDLLRNGFTYAGGLGNDVGFVLPVEDPRFARDGVMHEGAVSSQMGVPGRPEIAERMGAERLVALAELTGARLVLGPFSSRAAVECVELRVDAVDMAPRVTTLTSPAHLVFSDRDCATFDTHRRFDPPLRPDNLAGWLGAGFVDAIASVHRPHPAQETEWAFDQAPSGGAGLEVALAVAAAADDVALADVIERMTRAPGRVLGGAGTLAVGDRADICVVDPDDEWTIPTRPRASQAATTPYGGLTCRTRVRHTLVEAIPVVVDGELVNEGGVVTPKGER